MNEPLFSGFGPLPGRLRHPGLHRACLGLALLLAGPGTSVLAMDRPPSIQGTHGERRPAPVGFAHGTEDQMFVLETGRRCRTCRSVAERASCTHGPSSVVSHYTEVVDPEGVTSYEIEEICHLPPRFDRMAAGPGGTLIVASPQGELLKLTVELSEDGWDVPDEEDYLTLEDVEDLGLPAVPFQDFAVGPGGALVLAYGPNVAWLPREPGRCAREDVKWLLGGPPAPEEQKPDASGAAIPERTAGSLLAVDEEGIVFVTRPAEKCMFSIHPRAGTKEEVLAWSADDLRPVSLVAQGTDLHLALTRAKDPEVYTLCSMIDRGEKKPYEILSQRCAGRIDSPLGMRGRGNLMAYNAELEHIALQRVDMPSVGGVRADAKAETKAETREPTGREELAAIRTALAMLDAGAAYHELFREEEAKLKAERKREHRERARDAAAVSGGAGAGAASEPEPMDAGLDVDTAIRQHSSKFGLERKRGQARSAGQPKAPRAAASQASPKPSGAAGRSPSTGRGASAAGQGGLPTWAQQLAEIYRAGAPAPAPAVPPAVPAAPAVPAIAPAEAAGQPGPASRLNPEAEEFKPGGLWGQ